MEFPKYFQYIIFNLLIDDYAVEWNLIQYYGKSRYMCYWEECMTYALVSWSWFNLLSDKITCIDSLAWLTLSNIQNVFHMTPYKFNFFRNVQTMYLDQFKALKLNDILTELQNNNNNNNNSSSSRLRELVFQLDYISTKDYITALQKIIQSYKISISSIVILDEYGLSSHCYKELLNTIQSFNNIKTLTMDSKSTSAVVWASITNNNNLTSLSVNINGGMSTIHLLEIFKFPYLEYLKIIKKKKANAIPLNQENFQLWCNAVANNKTITSLVLNSWHPSQITNEMRSSLGRSLASNTTLTKLSITYDIYSTNGGMIPVNLKYFKIYHYYDDRGEYSNEYESILNIIFKMNYPHLEVLKCTKCINTDDPKESKHQFIQRLNCGDLQYKGNHLENLKLYKFNGDDPLKIIVKDGKWVESA